MQQAGLEWFFRFLQEPRRMFRRYFIEDMAFFGLMWQEWRHARRARLLAAAAPAGHEPLQP
jgi:N-acetylglucosaminyldiphosphoundecaprenol N-acetyl-beta-D-mannosaminyltransferase